MKAEILRRKYGSQRQYNEFSSAAKTKRKKKERKKLPIQNAFLSEIKMSFKMKSKYIFRKTKMKFVISPPIRNEMLKGIF